MNYPAAPYVGQFPNWSGPTINFPSPMSMGAIPSQAPSLIDSQFREMVKDGIEQMQQKKKALKRKEKRKARDKVRTLLFVGIPFSYGEM